MKREPDESFDGFVRRIRDTEDAVGEEPPLLVFFSPGKIDFDSVKRVRIRGGNIYDRNPGESWQDFERRFVEAEIQAHAAKTPARVFLQVIEKEAASLAGEAWQNHTVLAIFPCSTEI